MRWLSGGALGMTAACLLAQSYTPGPQFLTFLSSVDDSQQPYALYLPASFDPGRRYPLVISLHSEDSNHRLNLMQVLGQGNRIADLARATANYSRLARNPEYIIASPLARGTMGYRGIAEKDVYDVLADVERRFRIDEDRVYLTGISMGGGGALWLALTNPDLWAAVAPVCPVPIPGTDILAPNASALPIRLFHGDQDPIAPVASSRQWQRLLLDVGVPADYLEYPAVRHNAWDYAYRNGSLFDWFAKFRRNRYPERVRFVTDAYRYNSAYWVRIDGLTPGVRASIDARQTGAGAVSVETKNLDGLTLSLDHPVSAVTLDGTLLRLKPAATLSFRKQSGRWGNGRVVQAGKRPGLEGPIAEAVSGRHIYVYGTLGSPAPDELDFRRKQAETAASWSTARERLQLSLPVKADFQVTPEELDSDDLVLFGTQETNSLIARFAGRLPLALNAGAADYGLLFIAPLGKHYGLISSGLPWWTGFDEAARPVYSYAPPPYAELSTFPDYVIFKGALSQVVAEGRFDPNWKLPADAAAKITATGIVLVAGAVK